MLTQLTRILTLLRKQCMSTTGTYFFFSFILCANKVKELCKMALVYEFFNYKVITQKLSSL